MNEIKLVEGGKRTKGDGDIHPLLSIITVVYNGELYLEETINSVLSQKGDFEYIIIDGGSTDSTIDIIKRYESEIDFWISEKDKGIYHAMNKGIALAKGKLIGLINSDDYYMPNAFFHVSDFFLKNDCDIVYGNMDLIDAATCQVLETRKPKSWKLYLDMNLSHPSTFITKEMYSQLTYSLKYKIASDYDLLLKLKKEKKRFLYLDETLSSMRNGGVSASDSLNTEMESKAVKKHNLGLFTYCLSELYLFCRKLVLNWIR